MSPCFFIVTRSTLADTPSFPRVKAFSYEEKA